ncbi:nuclear transport factor 2 family protein [Mycobacterium syngnathidarum]|uniref:DUF4440 domain-containing protein n=1 Tax=Mycobacterium syngnathidarum TaxID=1908205 RepID=A0A1S1K8B4_9MYCO|nr:nuclear transport factor 2 family protein [Mycobacterium syngnathidarum]OHU01692.1 DUF4440 domain-containing protein [Mycobacterium syngnathidarum]
MSPSEAERVDDIANRLFDAIARGDTDGVARLWADDVAVWHAGDSKDNDRVRALKVIDWFVNTTTERRYEVLERRFFEGGFVQQHVLHAGAPDGTLIALRVCIVIKVGRHGLIHRIDEYFDPRDIAPLFA